MTGVSWYEADAYCRWVRGRLPTEAEWEWLARGQEGRRYPWGDSVPTARHASFDARTQDVTPVGIYPEGVTEFGIADLAGNVWEWCADWYSDYSDAAQTNPAGPDEGRHHVLRGGSFRFGGAYLRAAVRFNILPGPVKYLVGFRVVWSASGGQD